VLTTPGASAGETFTYALVSGTGSDDNASFTVTGNTLKTAAIFDYETKNSYSVRVRSTDQNGLSTEKDFTVTVTDVNETPTDIALSSNSVAENLASGTAVGTLSSTDPDAGNTFTYTLVSGAGGTDNASFGISGGTLKTAASFNYEVKNSYSIRVRTTDQGGLYFEKTFVISVTDVNETPTNVALSGSSVAENMPSGTAVGTLSSTDPDVGNTFTYTLVGGAGSTDNASFGISGGTLQTAASFNYEAKNSYSIRVRTTDQGGLYFEKAFTIGVTNVNETPTDIGLSGSSVAENQPVGTSVGTLSTTDPDIGDTFTYALVSGAGDTGNGAFTITGNTLKSAAGFDFETQSSYSIRVRATDAGGLWTEKAFAIGVRNVNEAPTDIGLGGGSVAENQPAGTTVGALSTVDPDAGDTFTYTLVGGAGDLDNAAFAVAGNTLQTAASFDFEVRSSYSIRVRSTDAGGLWTEKVFAIGVTNVNEAPTDVALSPAVVAWGAAAGTTVGALVGSDPDAGDTLTYSIVPGVGDAAAFAVVGNTLATTAVMDRWSAAGYSVRVRVTDAGGLWLEKDLAIAVQVPATSSISGTVFKDINADGIKGKGEGAMGSRKVFIDSDNDGVLDAGEVSTVSSATGAYTFGNLLPGEYHLRALPGKGWRVGGPIAGYDLTVGVGQVLTAKNFGVTQMALVSGTVFNDANGNKIKAATEAGLARWTVFVDKDNDGVLDKGELSARTNATGVFSLNLAAGSYTLCVVPKTGYKATTPADGKMAVKVAAGQVLASRMFGFRN
jgi:hypothetical protein